MRRVVMGLGLLFLAACAGITAREEGLMRVMAGVWPNVRTVVEAGVEDAVEAGDLDEQGRAALVEEMDAMAMALESGDRHELLSVDWATLSVFAERGIAARRGEIGPGVAASLRERNVRFNEAFIKVLSR